MKLSFHGADRDVTGSCHLVECAGRMPGDFIVPLIDRAWGIDSLALILDVMRGEAIDQELPREPRGGAAIRYLHALPGQVSEITGLDDARRVSGVVDAHVTVGSGDSVSALRSSWDRTGFVIAHAARADAAMCLAAKAAAMIKIETGADDAGSSHRARTAA